MKGLSIYIGILFFGISVAFSYAEEKQAERPASWAKQLNVQGAPNLFQVASNIYRCAQPEAPGFKELEKMGIRTVISFRANHDDKDLLEGTKLELIRIPMDTWKAKDEDVVAFLKTITDTNKFPIVFHCQHGADRTGMMCAIYRIAVCGWSKDDAVKEMTEGGFGYHSMWKNLVEYIKDADIESLRKKAGLGVEKSNPAGVPDKKP